MRLLELRGTPFEMGWQHGKQVRRLRPRIVEAMERRLTSLEASGLDFRPLEQELIEAWEDEAPRVMAMIRGQSQALELAWEPFFRYTVASYLEDRSRQPVMAQGCTVWAASPPSTPDGEAMLVKNRDYRPAHQALQYLARARPEQGYAYSYITSAGSPGVFSSGMNSAGLAVADTHVASTDLGLGVPRYALMMAILEGHARVGSALDYLANVRHLGDGTLVLLDSSGDMAVFEAGHTNPGVIRSPGGYLVSTNHYVTPGLQTAWIDNQEKPLRGNSLTRHRRVSSSLGENDGQVTPGRARKLMAEHGGAQRAICRHASADRRSVTISSVLYFPQKRMLEVGIGRTCRTRYVSHQVNR